MNELYDVREAMQFAFDLAVRNWSRSGSMCSMARLMSIPILQPWVSDPVFENFKAQMIQVQDLGADQNRFYLVKMAFNLSWPEDVAWKS